MERFNTPMQEMASITSAKGLKPALDIDNKQQGEEFLKAFDALVAYAAKAGTPIPGLKDAQNALVTARDIIEDPESYKDMKEEVQLSKIQGGFVAAANIITVAMDAHLQVHIPDPVETSFLQKILNLFTTTKEVKLYKKQKEIQEKLDQIYEIEQKKGMLIKVEFKGDDIKVSGLASDKVRESFLTELNKEGDINYTCDEAGNLTKEVDGETEKLSDEDIHELKEKLQAMDDSEEVLFKIKQIEIETHSVDPSDPPPSMSI